MQTKNIEEFIQFKFMPKILKTEHTSDTQKSVQIDFSDGMVLWFDVWKDDDGEITGDWNKYIFLVGNEEDDKIKAFQDANNEEAGAYNFATALELAETVFDN